MNKKGSVVAAAAAAALCYSVRTMIIQHIYTLGNARCSLQCEIIDHWYL
jgi:hypothetical protein